MAEDKKNEELEDLKESFGDLVESYDKIEMMGVHDAKGLIVGDLEAQKLAKLRVFDKSVLVIKTKLAGKKTKEYKEALHAVYRWERKRGRVSVQEEYELNAAEMKACKFECLNTVKLNSGGLTFQMGDTYKFSKAFDEARQKYVFSVYMPRLIEPEDQLSPELERKIRKGVMIEEDEYEKAKTLIRRVVLVSSEFNKYFKIIED